MLTIDADNFVSFLENSNALFGIFPDNSVQPIIYLASQTDTIRNIGLNQLGEKLEDKKCRTFFSIRITAEEERRRVFTRNYKMVPLTSMMEK